MWQDMDRPMSRQASSTLDRYCSSCVSSGEAHQGTKKMFFFFHLCVYVCIFWDGFVKSKLIPPVEIAMVQRQ